MAVFARWIVVDDTSPEINYIGGSWFSQIGNPISTQDTGFPYNNTLHGTNTNASLTFNFTGSSVSVKGTIQTPNVSSVDNPTWVCLVDGDQIGSYISRNPLTPTTSNSWIYCQSLRLKDGPHILTLNATGTEKTFWFDRIEYVPSATVPLDNKTISLSSPSDEDLHFSAGWSFGQTSQPGAHMTLNFVGTMLTWWTQYVADGNSTTATWTIDDKPAQNATLPDHKDDSRLFNQKVFDTGPLSMGRHHLTVTYNGNGSNTPLVLSSVFIENGTFPSKTIDPTAVPTSMTTSSSETSRPTTSKLTPLVIGGVVGVVVILLIIFVVFLFVFYRHRRKLAKLGVVEKFDIAPGYAQDGEGGPRNNDFGRDTNSSDSGSSSGHNILRSQPLPRKILDDLAGSAPPQAQIPQTVALYQPLPRKLLENSDVVSMGVGPSTSRERGVAHSPIDPSVGPSQGRVVVHHDSGVRMNNQASEGIVRDTPPEYT